jgi:hypothetical protein
MENSFYRKYNLPIVIASFIFLQYYLSHFLHYQYQWNFKGVILLPIAFASGIAIIQFIERASFSNIEKGKEKYTSMVLKQMKPKLDSALDDMCSKFDKERYERYLSPFYQKLKAVSEMMSNNIIDD